MGWVDRVFTAAQTAAVLSDRVERLSERVSDSGAQMRLMARRMSRLEGAFAVAGWTRGPSDRSNPPSSKTEE